MEKIRNTLRDKCLQILQENPALKGKSRKELEKITNDLLQFSELLYSLITEREKTPV